MIMYIHTQLEINLFLYPLTVDSRSQDGPGYFSIRFYNKLPSVVRDLPINHFKKKLKHLFLEKAFYSIEEYLNLSNLDFEGCEGTWAILIVHCMSVCLLFCKCIIVNILIYV